MNKDFERVIQQISLDELKHKRILITGANGLIGGFLADFLQYLNDQHQYGIEMVLTSLSQTPKRLEHLLSNSNVTYISKNLALSTGWDVNEFGKIDYCFYCAGYAQPSKFMSQPLDTLSINTIGLNNVLEKVLELNKEAKCIYLSSSEIYSASIKSEAHKEDDLLTVDINNKRNSYILGKVCGESVVNRYRDAGHKVISARVSLCYGPGVLADDTRVLSEIVYKGVGDFPTIKLFDDGSASRRYLHISDFILMLLNVTLKGSQGVYNICGEEECTIHQLASIVASEVGKEVEKGKSSSLVSQTAPKVVWNDLSRYKEEFGTMEFKPLQEGVVEFVNWYKEIIL